MRNIALKQVLADSLIDNVRKHSNHVFILECLFRKGNSLANLKGVQISGDIFIFVPSLPSSKTFHLLKVDILHLFEDGTEMKILENFKMTSFSIKF